jgi:hypothetical protein
LSPTACVGHEPIVSRVLPEFAASLKEILADG